MHMTPKRLSRVLLFIRSLSLSVFFINLVKMYTWSIDFDFNHHDWLFQIFSKVGITFLVHDSFLIFLIFLFSNSYLCVVLSSSFHSLIHLKISLFITRACSLCFLFIQHYELLCTFKRYWFVFWLFNMINSNYEIFEYFDEIFKKLSLLLRILSNMLDCQRK